MENRETLKTNPLKIVLKLNFSDGCGCQFTRIEVPIDFQIENGGSVAKSGGICQSKVPTDNVNQDKNVVIENLRDTAIQEKCCGQFSLVERKFISDPKKEIAVYAVATNIVMYNVFPENSDLLKPNLEGKRLRTEDNLDSKGKLKCHEDLKAKQVPLKKLKAY